MSIKPETYTIQNHKVKIDFLATGDIYSIKSGEISINQLLGNHIDGSLNNIYLRLYKKHEQIDYYPLLGINSNSSFSISTTNARWKGTIEDIKYEVVFHLADDAIWFWEVSIDDNHNQKVDLVYTQDIGLAHTNALQSNEAYVSQYIDHSVYKNHKDSFTICSRQNQDQQGLNPFIQQGSLQRNIGFSTDGFQFFGQTYKQTNVPEALLQQNLANTVYQYEFAYSALQSEPIHLNNKKTFIFYVHFQDNHPEAVTQLENEAFIHKAWDNVQSQSITLYRPIEKVAKHSWIGAPLCGERLTIEEMENLYPNRILEEKNGDDLFSFYTDTFEHVVLPEKELSVERPHGHIIMSGNNHKVVTDTITSNHYMYGMFNSQIAIGNTNMNKLLSNARNPLNIMKTSGQRIYIEMEGTFRLLTLPSVYELGFNYSRWYYKLPNDLLLIKAYTTVEEKSIHLEIRSLHNNQYRFLISNHITMHPNEDEVSISFERNNQIVTVTAGEDAPSKQTYPQLSYFMDMNETTFTLENEQFLINNGSSNTPFIIFKTDKTSDLHFSIEGSLTGKRNNVQEVDFPTEAKKYQAYYKKIMNHFHLSGPSSHQLNKLNVIAWWYTHNMLVHFSTPHGLEQYGGAAWGTRDVSQGPVEYFLATGQDDTVRSILIEIYKHQYMESGDFPQWFMFDQYNKIQQSDSHGDIIIWPLKVLGDYLKHTGDFTILDEEVPYTLEKDFTFTKQNYSIIEHVKKQLNYIQSNFLHDTHLSSYDDGDWDDTLQPANSQLKSYMISSWTVALTFESIRNLSTILAKTKYKSLGEELSIVKQGIQSDFQGYIMKDKIIPGFIYMENKKHIDFMLHPTDTVTGIDYRLLPMQESIISELFTKEQADTHVNIIEKHLTFPDGVRLMNRPAKYQGGNSTHFKRAEQAANFGREIGLQYVHAHIRFIEAMAKYGKAEQAWKGLFQINPVLIQETVPNAEVRQSNTYFSSSDGKFNTRYDAQEHFDKLRIGSIPVKGGWRIYSSGPGIYMNQLISNVLGIRKESDAVIIDPILPRELDGLTLNFELCNKVIQIKYHYHKDIELIELNGKKLEYTVQPNAYRTGGKAVPISIFKELLLEDNNQLDIYLA